MQDTMQVPSGMTPMAMSTPMTMAPMAMPTPMAMPMIMPDQMQMAMGQPISAQPTMGMQNQYHQQMVMPDMTQWGPPGGDTSTMMMMPQAQYPGTELSTSRAAPHAY